MPNVKSILLSWNGQFPSAFGGLAVGQLQFGYAIFQLLRSNALFHLLLFFLPTLLLRCLYLHRRHVVLLSEKKQYSTGRHALPERLNDLTKLGLSAKRESIHWYSVSYRDHHYLSHANSLMPLADLCQKHGDHTDRFLFADCVVEVTDMVKVAKLISTPEAIDKLLTGSYQLCDADAYTFYHCLDWLKVDTKWIPVLSCVPIYLQAIGANNLSGAFSCLVILLDFFKNRLWSMYDKLFTKLTDFVKLRIFGKRTWLYDLLGVFSDRWKYCDINKKHAYVLERDSLFFIGHVCRFKKEHDFEVVDADDSVDRGPHAQYRNGELMQWAQRDEDYYFDIIDGKAHFRLRRWSKFYVYVKTGCDIFVSDGMLLCRTR